MKRIVYIALVLSSMLLFIACNEKPNSKIPGKTEQGTDTIQQEPPIPIDGSEHTGFFLTGVTDLQEVVLQSKSNPLWDRFEPYSVRPGVWVLVKGAHYSVLSSKQSGDYDRFVEAAHRLGDVDYKDAVPTPECHETAMWNISSIEITALTHYNEAHPAGSVLNDVAVFSYESMYPFISSGYASQSDSEYNGLTYVTMLGITPYVQCPLGEDYEIKIPYIEAYPSWGPEYYIGNYLGFLEFTQAPDEPKQKIRVTLTLENGEKLRAETEIDFTVKP